LLLYFAVYYIIIIFYPRQSLFFCTHAYNS